jgi:hypothetical protein
VLITAVTTAAGPPATVTFTAAHKFKVNDIVLLKSLPAGYTITSTGIAGIAAANAKDGTLGVPVIVTATNGTTLSSGLVTATSATATFTFAGTVSGTFVTNTITAESAGYGLMTSLKTALTSCQNQYSADIIAGGAAGSGAANTRLTCITTAISPYTRTHCQWLPQTAGASLPIPGNTDEAKPAYDAYQSNIKLIQLAYLQAANRAAAGTFSGISDTTKAIAIVNAARSADLTGATQKYLATVCPGFYQPGDPGSNDPTTGYKNWSADITSASDTVATSAPTQKHFYASCGGAGTTCTGGSGGISDANILTWAQFARSPVTFTTGSGLSATTALLNTSVVVGATTYQDKSANGGTGTENWRTAYSNGPGTFVGTATPTNGLS